MYLNVKQTIGLLIRLGTVIFFLGIPLKNEWSSFYREHMYANMITGVFYWFFLGFFVVMFIYDFDRFATHERKIMFLPTAVGLLMIISVICINRVQHYRTHAKNAFIAEYLANPDDENNVKFHLELKHDGNYVLYHSAYSGMVMFFYYGEYKLKGNHLILFASNNLPGISNRLIITDGVTKTLVQTNSNWQPIEGRKKFKFRRL